MSQPTPEIAPPSPAGEDRDRWFTREVHPHSAPLKAWLHGSFPELRHDTDDVVQDSLLKTWQAQAIKPIHAVKAYLFGTARHRALNFLRRKRRSPIDSVSNLEALGAYEHRPTAADVLSLQEKVELLTDLIAALPPRQREAIILTKYEFLTAQEASDRLGRTRRSVENDLLRGIKEVRAQLQRHGIDSLYSHETR